MRDLSMIMFRSLRVQGGCGGLNQLLNDMPTEQARRNCSGMKFEISLAQR
jgi:hypothetical protein